MTMKKGANTTLVDSSSSTSETGGYMTDENYDEIVFNYSTTGL